MQPGLSLELTWVLPVRRERLFEYFVDGALLARWWGPTGFEVPSIDFAPRVGARYRIEMQPPGGDAFQLVGTFQEVDAPSRLVFTFEWQPPDADDVETTAQLTFKPIDHATELHLRQGPFATEARRALHHDGWNESIDRLAGLVGDPG